MGTSETIPCWSLNDLLSEPIEPAIEQILAQLEKDVADVETRRAGLTEDISNQAFQDFLKLIEKINSLMKRLEGYAFLWLSEDTQNDRALNLRDHLDQTLVNLGNRVLFFEIWFKDLPDETARRLIQNSGDLGYYLESIRRFKPHTLNEREEKIFAMKDPNGIDALVGLYEIITNRFSFTMEMDGQKKSMTRDELTTFYFNSSSQVRQAAYQELYRVYRENSTVLAQIYSHRVRDWYSEGIELRGYSSPISARNLGNDLPDEVVETLLSVCRKNASLFQGYFLFKAKHLGTDKLRRYDIYSPLTTSDKKYEFEYSLNLILDTFREFSPHMAELATRVHHQNHLDAQVRQGKRGGGFCLSTLPELTPWVLVNFNGRAGDIATLAHELGHAVHAMLAAGHSVLSFHPPQPLAETASVFAEMQLTDRLLREEHDPAVRRDLLVRVIDDAYATVIRQAYFTIFERDAHRMLVEGSSFDDLCKHYFSLLQEQFGLALEITDEFKWEWITIPHIYETPFYTYSYSFGLLLVLALYQQYRREGAAFIPRYMKILSHGGSAAPMMIMQEAGLDVTSQSFWQGGFDVLAGMIRELTENE